ncbi:MAG: DUF5666 domain-containing protein [Pseudomonadota bacterium]
MNKSILRSVTLAAVTALGVTACGGDGGGDVAGGGVTGTGISYGTVTGFGSVFVNGVKYNTDAATIALDDNPGVEGELRVGMVVKLEGTVNDDKITGTATKIEYNDVLEGTVNTAPDLATNTMVVMGQTVRFDNLTVYEDKVSGATGTMVNFSGDVATNNVIEVSGWSDDSGVVRAARVERKAASLGAGAELEIKGVVANLDEAGKTFTIGGLTINYANVVSVPSNLANGMMVEVKSTQTLSGNTMTASRVEAEDSPFTGMTSGRLEIEGYVTAVTGTEFTVLGQRVKTTSATVYENGTAADIAVGKKIEVKGTVGSDGTFTAVEISFRLPNNVEIEGTVTAVNSSANTVTVMGVAVQLNAVTQMEDASDAKQRPFALANLSSGDFVEIRGYMKDGQVIATRLERDDLVSEVLLQGAVAAKADDLSTLTILGVTVNTSTSAVYRLTSDGPPVSRADFFSAVSANATVVKAKGAWNGSSIIATEMEIED